MGKLIRDIDPALRESLRLDDFEAYMIEAYGTVFPDAFPLVTTVDRWGGLEFENLTADDEFDAWRSHLRFAAREIGTKSATLKAAEEHFRDAGYHSTANRLLEYVETILPSQEQPSLIEGSETVPLPTNTDRDRNVPLSTHPDPMRDRQDWREYQQALKTVAGAFGATVSCHQKYDYMCVRPNFDGLTREQYDALSTLADLVELVSGFPEGYLGRLEPQVSPVDTRLREMVLADLREHVAKALVSRPNDQALGYLQGKIVAFALSGVITKEEFHDFHDDLERVGLSSRMPGWDRSQ